MATHTPGPYTQIPAKNHIKIIAHVPHTGARLIAEVRTDHGSGEEDFANANLFIAAPELLEALKKILSMNPDPGREIDHNDFVDAIIASERAIAKAEGVK